VNIQSRPEYSVITSQTLRNFFANASNFSVMNVRCSLSILGVQSVHQLQQVPVTHDRGLFGNDRIALSVNSCGKSFNNVISAVRD